MLSIRRAYTSVRLEWCGLRRDDDGRTMTSDILIPRDYSRYGMRMTAVHVHHRLAFPVAPISRINGLLDDEPPKFSFDEKATGSYIRFPWFDVTMSFANRKSPTPGRVPDSCNVVLLMLQRCWRLRGKAWHYPPPRGRLRDGQEAADVCWPRSYCSCQV